MAKKVITWIKKLVERILGRKYYLVVFRTNNGDDCEISSHRFRTKREALRFGLRISATSSLDLHDVVSFRSKEVIPYYIEED